MKKFISINLIVRVVGRVEKYAKKKGKKCKKIFFVLNKYENVTHVSTFIFQGIFKIIVLDL